MHVKKLSDTENAEALSLRQEGGAWLRSLREAARLSQRELAAAAGTDYYSFVSQIEAGKGRVPTNQIRVWAETLGVAPREFAINLMKFYDPVNYELIFGAQAVAPPPNVVIESLNERLVRLESMLERQNSTP